MQKKKAKKAATYRGRPRYVAVRVPTGRGHGRRRENMVQPHSGQPSDAVVTAHGWLAVEQERSSSSGSEYEDVLNDEELDGEGDEDGSSKTKR
ncbi:hypothetical protein HPB50_006963 [Hyalomma asiaticum]|uniref:Uncharacterized protein n=1 Tax=Hyalomma asiaticum TaxID=266040 RepID=A0ACB7TFD8_HYAAI|nr:hypothetical protein HPB50_006963 [Hyalomma asiaticum]